MRDVRERHKGPANLAAPVLSAALVTAIMLGIHLAGGVFGGQSISPRVAARPLPSRLSSLPATAIRERMAIEQAQVMAVELERQRMIGRLTAHMQATGVPQALIDLAPMMVDLGRQTGMDCRLCVITAQEESTSGRGSYDLFGTKGHSSIGGQPWDTQVSWYFNRIKEISDTCGYGGDVYQIAWYWYGGGSSMGGRAENYASNIARAVQSF